MRSVCRERRLHDEVWSGNSWNSRTAGTELRNGHSSKSDRELELQRLRSQHALRRKAFGLSARLHLQQIDRSGIEPRRADQSVRYAAEPLDFFIRHEDRKS